MRKYENVDFIAALGAVVEINTEHYKSDFKYDVDMFKKAARCPDGEINRFLWLSRQSGTECFRERDVYLIESQAHNSWPYYADRRGEGLRAYAVEITGLINGRVMGNLYELDYREHAAEVKKNALHVSTVSAKYADGTELHLSYKEWDGQRERLYHQHGELKQLRREPENEGDLRDILKTARAAREKAARPAAFKVRVQNPKQPPKPSIKQKIAAGKNQLAAGRAAAPERAAEKTKSNALEV
jgi:hypothetical protein